MCRVCVDVVLSGRGERERGGERMCVCVKGNGDGLGNFTSYDEREEVHGKDRETGKQRRERSIDDPQGRERPRPPSRQGRMGKDRKEESLPLPARSKHQERHQERREENTNLEDKKHTYLSSSPSGATIKIDPHGNNKH